MWVYVKVQSDGLNKISNSRSDIVKRMCSNISGTGQNIAADNWFISYELVHKMFNCHHLTVVGNLRKSFYHRQR